MLAPRKVGPETRSPFCQARASQSPAASSKVSAVSIIRMNNCFLKEGLVLECAQLPQGHSTELEYPVSFTWVSGLHSNGCLDERVAH